MKKRTASEFVHEYKGRWVVAQYRDGRYYAPQRTNVQELTGCHTTYGSLSYVAGHAYSYKRRSDALRRARQVFMLDD